MNTLPDAWIRTFVAEQCTFTLDEDAMRLDWVVHEIREDFGDMSDPALMEQTLRVVLAMLATGMRAIVSPYHPDGYEPWPDQRPDAVLARIRSEWLARGEEPIIPDSPWFGPSRSA